MSCSSRTWGAALAEQHAPLGQEAEVLPKEATQRPFERDEQQRWSFLKLVRCTNPFKLVSLDETSTRLGMRRAYVDAPVGVRAHAELVRNFGPNRTLISAMSVDGVLLSFLVEGGITRRVFEHYLEHMLLPALGPWQVLVLDNYTVHRGRSVERLVQEAGCEVLYLPSYGPDSNPIEMPFSKLKAHLNRAAALTLSALSMAIKEALEP